MTYGENAYGAGSADMTRPHPLISIRLAPSVDSGLTGSIGQKEIVNRMILSLNNAGVTTNKDVTAFFILNGLPSKLDYLNVETPALSQLISHESLKNRPLYIILNISTKLDSCNYYESGSDIAK